MSTKTDDEGLVHALLFDGDGGVQSLDWDGVRRWKSGDGLLWVHLSLTSEEVARWLRRESDLPKVAVQGLLALETRPRTITIGEGALVQLRGVNLNPGADPEDMVSARLWIEKDRIVSSRRRRLLSVQDTVEAVKANPPASAGAVVAILADCLVERMSDIIDQLEARVAELEAVAMEEPNREMRSQLAALRREAIALRRYLAPQREALSRLHAERVPWLSDTDRLRLREVTDRLIRHLEDLEAARERAAVVQEELLSTLSDQLNRRMYVLSVVAAVFLPLGFLTGLLGINVGGIPGAESKWGFLAFIGILIAIVAAQVIYFYKRRWF